MSYFRRFLLDVDRPINKKMLKDLWIFSNTWWFVCPLKKWSALMYGFAPCGGFHNAKGATQGVIIEGWRCHYNTIRPHSAEACDPLETEILPPFVLLRHGDDGRRDRESQDEAAA